MIKVTFFTVALLCVSTHSHAGAFGNKHVLVIGVDGLGSNQFLNANIPNIKSLLDDNTAYSLTSYAGGMLERPSQQPTSSGPGWTSILTGVWTD